MFNTSPTPIQEQRRHGKRLGRNFSKRGSRIEQNKRPEEQKSLPTWIKTWTKKQRDLITTRQELNRMIMTQAALIHADEKPQRQQEKLGKSDLRKSRTRTLIQLGGLVSLTGLLDYCDINIGEDLQEDITKMDKAAVLLGILLETYDNVPNEPDEAKINAWM